MCFDVPAVVMCYPVSAVAHVSRLRQVSIGQWWKDYLPTYLLTYLFLTYLLTYILNYLLTYSMLQSPS